MTLLETRHIALLLLGLDASQPANALPEEHQEHYRILHDAISRTIKATGMVSAPANKRMFYADEIFALAWWLIDDELTPPEIKARSLKAVMKLSRNSRGRKWLKTLGDEALPDLTIQHNLPSVGCINATRHRRILPDSAGCWFSFWLRRLTGVMGRLINRLRIGYFESRTRWYRNGNCRRMGLARGHFMRC